MKQFEYRVIEWTTSEEPEGMQDNLNTMGRKGWELVNVEANKLLGAGYFAYLKREKECDGPLVDRC